MILISTLALTILHPGPSFRGHWNVKSAMTRMDSPEGVVLEMKSVFDARRPLSVSVREVTR
jgi:hypothetical protein